MGRRSAIQLPCFRNVPAAQRVLDRLKAEAVVLALGATWAFRVREIVVDPNRLHHKDCHDETAPLHCIES